MNGFSNKLREVFGELRKAGMLPVVAVLIIAIFAVPMVLKAGGAEPAPPTELAVGLKPILETESVVLAETPVLRDFRVRLNRYSSKNPFHQPQPAKVPSLTAASTDPGASTAPATSSLDTGAAGSDVPSTEPPAADPPAADPPADEPSDGSTDDPTDPDPTKPGSQVLSYEIDIEIGKAGEEKSMDGVRVSSILPSGKSPLLQFVSTDLQGTSAAFVLSPDIVGAEGDGNCAPSRRDCQFLKLEVGDAERFDYEPDGETYRIKLRAITAQIDVLEKLSSAADEIAVPIGYATQWKVG